MLPQTSIPALNERTARRNSTILVADDEPINRKLIQKRLEREGYKVIVVEDGQAAVNLSRRMAPDLVILDVMMPVMDGFQACRLIKGDTLTQHIPVIFLSARDETDLKVEGFAIGADDFINKPFDAEELIARVSVSLRIKRELDLLRTAAEQAHADAERAQEHAMQAQERAITDALTGLLNRHSLGTALAREIAEAKRYARPLTMLMADLDNFKAVNDTHGHLAGDIAIRQSASILTEALRRSDIVFRYGGEEFLILLPETNLAGGVSIAEKIRAGVAASLFGPVDNGFHLTISIGIAELNPEEPDLDLLERADAALYLAKNEGRNRVKADIRC